MKNRMSLFAIALACSSLTAFADATVVECSGDMRIVDGPLITYTLTKNAETNSFSLTKESSGYNRMTGKEFKNSSTLEEKMKCTLSADLTFRCSRDMRMVDGPVHTFTLSKNAESNKYTLTSHASRIDMRTGEKDNETETLSADLSCE